jgi:parvulin-like peptidyl-prolyl isomerase
LKSETASGSERTIATFPFIAALKIQVQHGTYFPADSGRMVGSRYLRAKGFCLFSKLDLSINTHRLICCTALLGVSLSVIGQAQAQPGSDSGKPAANAAAASTTSASPAKDKVILKVGNLQITQQAFEQYIADLEAQQGPADLSRKKLADNYSSLLMLSQQAVAKHLDTSPDVVRQLAIDRVQILSNAEFARLKQQATPSAKEIKAYYDAHLDDYDLVKIRRVFIFGSARPGEAGPTREQAKTISDAVKNAIAAHKDVIATINGIPHGRTDVVADPDPLTFQRGELPPTMDKAAFDLKEGQWTQLSDNPDEFVFIQLVNRSRKPLDEVSSQIEKKVQADQLHDELDALKSKAGIWMDEEYFASKAPVTTSTTQPDASGQGKSGAERGER